MRIIIFTRTPVFHLIVPIVIILTFQAILSADAAENQEGYINKVISCVSWEKPIHEPLYIRSKGSMEPLRVHNMKRSQPFDYHGPNPMIFYRPKGQSEAGENQFEEVARFSIDTALEQPLLFFVKDDNQYKVFALEDSFEKYPTSSYRFYNFTDKHLIAKMGSDTLQLEPRKAAFLEKPFENSQEYPVIFVVKAPDQIRPLYSNRWTHSNDYRYLIIISENESRDIGPLRFHILADYQRPNS